MKKLDVVLNIVAPLLIGLVIYHFSDQLKGIGFVRNQLPDGLWAYSLSSSILIIWDRKINLVWLVAISILFLLFEYFQYMHLIKGVADLMDVAVYFSFFSFSLLINYFLNHQKQLKMNSVKNILSASAIFVFIVMAVASAGGVKSMSFSKSSGQIPPDFGLQNDTLIVLKSSIPGDINGHLRSGFRNLYSGPYKIINKKELKNYPPERYRFLFQFENVGSSITEYNASTGQSQSGPGTLECTVTDRITKKQYSSGNTAFYGKLLKAYIPALDKELKR